MIIRVSYRKKIFIKSLCFVVPLVCFSFIYIFSHAEIIFPVKFTFLLLLLISIFRVAYSKIDNSITLKKIFYIFVFFFFGIAPIEQLANKTVFLGPPYLNQIDYLKINILILCIIFVYEVFYDIGYSYMQNNNFFNDFKSHPFDKKVYELERWKGNFLVGLVILVFLILFWYNDFNFIYFFARGLVDEMLYQKKEVNLMVSLLINSLRFVPLLVYLYFFVIGFKTKKLKLFLFLMLLLINFPTSIPRFQVAIFYLPIAVLEFKMLSRYLVFPLILYMSLLVIFPFLNIFRDFSSNVGFGSFLNFTMFNELHFDSYSSLAKVVKGSVVTYGNQLLGVLFFFIPRSIWSNKPVGSGEYLANLYDYDFGNISMNYFGEGFVNFGFFGIFLFVIFLSAIHVVLDFNYYNKRVKSIRFVFFYLFFMSLQIMFLRGDLLTNYSIIVSFLVYLWLFDRFLFSVHGKNNNVD
jgi:hypothetical protein